MTVAYGIYQPRKGQEVDELRRAVRPYEPDFTFQIGGYQNPEYPETFPHYVYRTFEEFIGSQERPLRVVAMELDTHALPLGKAGHLDDVAYLFGPNTGTIPRRILDQIGRVVMVETPGHRALHTSAVAAIVAHDRYVTLTQQERNAA